MKTLSSATRIVAAFSLVALGICLASPSASAGLFHRRTVVVETPAVYVAPAPTVYAAPVTTIYQAPAPAVYSPPVVDPYLAPTSYVPTVSSSVVSAPVTTTYVPTMTTLPSVVVPTTRMRVVYPRRTYLYGY